MNKIIQLIFLLLLTSLFSCRENDMIGQEEGVLQLNVNMQSDLPIISTRATLTDEELKENCKVYIRNSQGLVRKFTALNEVPSNILLVADQYKVEVRAGDSVPASFKDSYYKGNKEFILSAGQTLSQTVECKIQNTVTCVALASDLAEAFPSYIITLSTRKGKLEYTPDSIGQAGYFMLLTDENQLNWKFEGIMPDGKKVTNVGTIKQVKRSFKYMLTFENPSLEVGGGMIQVTVDATELAPQDMEIGLDARPIIQYAEDGKTWLDMDNPAYRALNTSTPVISIGGAANSAITSFSIGSEYQRLSTEFPSGIASYDFINMNDKEKENLERLGLTFMLRERENGGQSVSVSFSEALMAKMTGTTNSIDGANTYKFDVAIVDSKGKSRNKTLTIITTDVAVATEDVILGDVWAKSAILRGRIIDQSKATNLYFQYRKTGTPDWIKLTNNITVKDEICVGTVTGLEPATNYEYQVVAGDPSVPSPIICTFTTEAAEQLPNWQFEEWSSESNSSLPLLICQDESSMFWDSGNHGSKMGSVNVTTHDETIKNSGRYSAKLSSQKVGVNIGIVIGKFAAGNLFAGKYLDTDGTDGVLRFGRPWVSRPSGFKVWVKYNSAKVNHSKDPELPMNSQDIASIYIALGDWKHNSYGGDSDIPVLVKTKSKEFFDPNSSNIIGYGVLDLKGSTQEEGMVLKEVPIIYRSNRIPTDIVAVASASKYGDYFAGGEGSTLWLDDLELIYSDEIQFEK